MGTVNLSQFDNRWYKPGRSFIVRGLWYLTSSCFFESSFPFSGIKKFLLKCFGARIGRGVVIKPHVRIKYPWKLSVGDHTWIGEDVWIDNLEQVSVGDHCCISQGAYILTGNHDYRKISFDLMVKPVVLESGSWVGARSVVCPGVTLKNHAVLSVGSVATSDLEPMGIYQGNPATRIREREIR